MISNKNAQALILILFAALCGFWIYELSRGEMPGLDIVTRPLAEHSKSYFFYPFFRWMTMLGSSSFLIPFTLASGVLLYMVYRRLLEPLMLLGGSLGGWLLNHGIKAAVHRERPSIDPLLDAIGTSFPSGHAMSSMVCYGLLAAWLIKRTSSGIRRKWIGIAAMLLILLVGISRYILNVHYLTDVLAGYFFGYLFILVWLRIWTLLQQRMPD